MKAYCINAETDKCEVMDVEPSLSEYYRIIGCDCIDITIRRIGEVPFNIVLDDEGLLKPNRITASDVQYRDGLAGTLLIFGVREDLELRSLTDSELALLESHVAYAVYADGTVRPALFYTC